MLGGGVFLAQSMPNAHVQFTTWDNMSALLRIDSIQLRSGLLKALSHGAALGGSSHHRVVMIELINLDTPEGKVQNNPSCNKACRNVLMLPLQCSKVASDYVIKHWVSPT